jgi:hypothetical protein
MLSKKQQEELDKILLEEKEWQLGEIRRRAEDCFDKEMVAKLAAQIPPKPICDINPDVTDEELKDALLTHCRSSHNQLKSMKPPMPQYMKAKMDTVRITLPPKPVSTPRDVVGQTPEELLRKLNNEVSNTKAPPTCVTDIIINHFKTSDAYQDILKERMALRVDNAMSQVTINNLREKLDDLHAELEDAKASKVEMDMLEKKVFGLTYQLRLAESNHASLNQHCIQQSVLIDDAKRKMEEIRAENNQLKSEKCNQEHMARKLIQLQSFNVNLMEENADLKRADVLFKAQTTRLVEEKARLIMMLNVFSERCGQCSACFHEQNVHKHSITPKL